MLFKKKGLFVLLILIMLISVCCLSISAKEVIIFSGTFNPGQAQVDTQNKFKELLEERSEGKYEVRVVIGSAMGGGREHLEACQSGAIHLISIGPESIGIYNPSYNVENIPYLFEDWDHLFSYLNGKPGEIVRQKVLDTLNIRTLGIQIRGARYLTSNKPIYSRDDLQGLKLRLSETATLIRIWGATGASPVPVAFNELYSALQTGIVEAQENPIETIYGQKFYEVQDYLMETEHILSVSYFQASEKWFSSLSEEDQKLISECMTEAVEYGGELAVERIEKYKDEIVDKGWMTLIKASEMDLESIRSAAVEEIAKMVEEGVYDKELFNMAIELKQ
jgi:tripartite ATP-independent transporter DctP family solute receptor